VKRHPALVPLSHDHHHALVEARRLRRAAAADSEARASASAAFLHFFASNTVPHFREEEESLFPLLLEGGAPPPELLVEALLDHQRLHGLRARLEREPEDAATMVALADLLERHVRLEERQLFPLIEAAASDAGLERATRRRG